MACTSCFIVNEPYALKRHFVLLHSGLDYLNLPINNHVLHINMGMKISVYRACYAYQIKSFITLAVLRGSSKQICVAHFRVIVPASNTALPKKCRSCWEQLVTRSFLEREV